MGKSATVIGKGRNVEAMKEWQEHLKKQLELAEISARKLALLSGVNQNSLSHIMGKNRKAAPTLSLHAGLADGLNIPQAALITGENWTQVRGDDELAWQEPVCKVPVMKLSQLLSDEAQVERHIYADASGDAELVAIDVDRAGSTAVLDAGALAIVEKGRAPLPGSVVLVVTEVYATPMLMHFEPQAAAGRENEIIRLVGRGDTALYMQPKDRIIGTVIEVRVSHI